MQRRIPFLIVLVITLLLLAACGGDESTPEPLPTSEPAADTAPASAPESEEADTSSEPAAAEEAESYPEPAAVEEAESYPEPASVEEAESYPQPASVEEAEAYPEPVEGESSTDSSGDGARTFQVVPAESDASYTVEEEFFNGAVSRLGKDLGFFTAIGLTQEVNGQLTLNLADVPSLESGEITVDISTLTSDDDRRDGRIREKYLESAKYPLATFVATGIEEGPASYEEGQEVSFKLVGDMTIRESTTPVTFDVTAKLEGDTITGVATTQLLMTDFGFDPPDVGDFMKAENEVLVTVNLTAKEASQ